jgi:hypothetical protein
MRWALYILLFCASAYGVLWFFIAQAENFDYSKIAGTYTAQQGTAEYTITLKSDRTFTEEVIMNDSPNEATGTWDVAGEGHIRFSGGMVDIDKDTRAPGSTDIYGDFANWFGFASINFPQKSAPLNFRKTLFH